MCKIYRCDLLSLYNTGYVYVIFRAAHLLLVNQLVWSSLRKAVCPAHSTP